MAASRSDESVLAISLPDGTGWSLLSGANHLHHPLHHGVIELWKPEWPGAEKCMREFTVQLRDINGMWWRPYHCEESESIQ